MLQAILTIFAIYSIAFSLKETALLDRPRNFLMRNSKFFYDLLSCYHCTGSYAGLIGYLLFNQWCCLSYREAALWFFAGGAISFILNGVSNKLYEVK